MKKYVITGFLLLLSCNVTANSTLDGNFLLEECSTPAGNSFCLGYILAWREVTGFGRDVYEVTGDRSAASWSSVCEPYGVSSQQALDVVLKWIRDNPQSRHYTGLQIVNIAWQTAWPCAKDEDKS